MKQPHEFNRRVLLCVIGMTPQIVTETLYKLAVDMKPKFIPTETHLITTGEGEKSARHALLGVDGKTGEFHNFCRDYPIKNITFTQENIHKITGTDDHFINDTHYSKHNEIAADFITKTVRLFTEDDDCALHLSLAGGRKTMSYYAGYALSLYGRMQDRLSHVLVAKPFQENDQFFYPPPKPKRIAIKNKYYSTDDANIILSEMPFVQMRYQVPEKLLEGTAGFRETVDLIQRLTGPPTIEIDINKKEVRLNGVKVEMNDAYLAIYLWMCERKIEGKPPFIPKSDAFFKDYFKVYSRIAGEMSGMIDRLEDQIEKWREDKTKKDPHKKWFQSHNSSVKKIIKDTLGSQIAQPFLIQTVEYRGTAGYEMNIARSAINITT